MVPRGRRHERELASAAAPERAEHPFDGDRPSDIVAKPAELLQIADYLGLLELRSLVADISATRSGSNVSLAGRVHAELVQRCVVTLVPVVQSIDEAFDRRLVRETVLRHAPQSHQEVVVGEADPPDLYAGDAIDLGAIVLEQLTLAIDPYPRAPGAELPQPASAHDEHAEFALCRPEVPWAKRVVVTGPLCRPDVSLPRLLPGRLPKAALPNGASRREP